MRGIKIRWKPVKSLDKTEASRLLCLSGGRFHQYWRVRVWAKRVTHLWCGELREDLFQDSRKTLDVRRREHRIVTSRGNPHHQVRQPVPPTIKIISASVEVTGKLRYQTRSLGTTRVIGPS